MALPPVNDVGVLGTTRRTWHSLAEHVLAAARYAAVGRIGLLIAPGGFGTPPFETGGATFSAQIVGDELQVQRDDHTVVSRLTTLADAAESLGIPPGAPTDVYTPTTPLDAGAPLEVDLDAAAVLAAWFELSWAVLETLARDDASASTLTLWPEHFDAAVELGDEGQGTRGTFGASPGDAEHPEPYLYVTHWAEVPDDPYWNDTAFAGASLGYSALTGANPLDEALAFFRSGVERLTASKA